MFDLKQWFSAQAMKVQIGIYQCIVLLIALLLLILVFQVHLSMLLPQFSEMQRGMFLHMSNQRLDSILLYHQRLVTTFINLNANQLIAMHQLNLASQYTQSNLDQQLNYDFTGFNKFPDSLNLTKTFGTSSKSTFSFMCGSNQTDFNASNPMNQLIYTFSNQIGTLGNMINVETYGIRSLLYGGLYSDPVMFYTYPCLNFGGYIKKYPLKQRPWYLKATKEYEANKDLQYKPKFTDPYAYASGSLIDISLVIPQIDTKQQFIGAWAIDLQGSMFTKYLQSNEMAEMILLVDRSGILLVHTFDNPEGINPLYIYNQSITGYSIDDWNQIYHHNNSANNCDPKFYLEGKFCKYNTILSKELHVFITKIEQYELYIIILHDFSPAKQQINSENERIQDFIQLELMHLVFYLIILFLAVTIIFGLFMAHIISKPIHHVVLLIRQELSNKSIKKCITIKLPNSWFNSHQVTEVLTAFKQFITRFGFSQIHKSEQCQLFEKFKYPFTHINDGIGVGQLTHQLQNEPSSSSQGLKIAQQREL